MAPRDTYKGVGVGRKACSEAGEAVRRGHFFSAAFVLLTSAWPRKAPPERLRVARARAKLRVAIGAAVNGERLLSVSPRREASVAGRNRRRPGSDMLTSCPSVIKQHVEDWLSLHLNSRDSQSMAQSSNRLNA